MDKYNSPDPRPLSPEEQAKAQQISDDFKKIFDEANQQLVKMGMSPLPMPELKVPPKAPGPDFLDDQ